MKHTTEELKMMQQLPLEMKEQLSIDRVRSWVNVYGENGCFVSYSGGKDSTVLIHLVHRIYPNIPAVYVDTGLEYPEVRRVAIANANIVLKPKMKFRDVISKYGYPVISKEVAEDVHKFKATRSDFMMRKLLYGIRRNGQIGRLGTIPKKHIPLIYAPFDVHNACCDVMKKKPMKEFRKETSMMSLTGTMAEESMLRTSNWLQYGCNAYDINEPNSAPLSFWTNEDILRYIIKYNINIPSVYGDITQNDDGKLSLTGVKRTGCVFCMFGCHLEKEPNRFQLLKQTHPALYEYCIYGGSNQGKDGKWRPTKEGLGMWKVLDYIGVPYE